VNDENKENRNENRKKGRKKGKIKRIGVEGVKEIWFESFASC